jgi:hypothetical protein
MGAYLMIPFLSFFQQQAFCKKQDFMSEQMIFSAEPYIDAIRNPVENVPTEPLSGF